MDKTVWLYTTTGWRGYFVVGKSDYDGSGLVNAANTRCIEEDVPEWEPLELCDTPEQFRADGIALLDNVHTHSKHTGECGSCADSEEVYLDWLHQAANDERPMAYRCDTERGMIEAQGSKAPDHIPDGHATVLVRGGLGYGGQVTYVRLDTQYGIETAACLDDYPLLSDEIHSDLEEEACAEAWNSESIRGRIELLKRGNKSIFAARREWGELWNYGFQDDTGYLRDHLIC